MNILHVGLGVRGKDWLAKVRTRSDVTSVGCVDPDASALSWTRIHVPELGTACYPDLDEALRSTRADAAIIASPGTQHARHAIKALEAGLAVMVEIPFAGSLAEAAQVVEVGRLARRAVMVAHHHRYTRCERRLRRLVEEGKVGTITHVSCMDRRSRPAGGSDVAGAEYPQVVDVATHHFDTLRAILGVNPVSVMARCGTSSWSAYGPGSRTEALLEMERNIHVQYHGSLTPNRDEHMLWIEGDTGVLWTDGVRIWWRKRGWPVFLPVRWGRRPPGDARTPPREVTALLLQELKAAVVEGRRPETNGEEYLWTLSMVEAVMRSDKTARVVGIAELLSATLGVRPVSDLAGQGAGA
jgi:predicted dehydrogenase